MQERIDPVELRSAARFVEETALSAIATYSAISVPVYAGTVDQFPRPSQPDLAAQEGIEALRELLERVVLSFYTLAQAAERGLNIPPVLLIPLQPYLNAFRERAQKNGDQL